jgi:hypothetical protein
MGREMISDERLKKIVNVSDAYWAVRFNDLTVQVDVAELAQELLSSRRKIDLLKGDAERAFNFMRNIEVLFDSDVATQILVEIREEHNQVMKEVEG